MGGGQTTTKYRGIVFHVEGRDQQERAGQRPCAAAFRTGGSVFQHFLVLLWMMVIMMVFHLSRRVPIKVGGSAIKIMALLVT
ncbi:hypothetical protein HPB50_024091 [Hyalomma asiaticum]|uniref:Uncharacterized protein n=1 Tax=Hyalomma asiaticum TaxID=266040 RepID=A0ACB7SPZ7_HYAAI|nr:hypothetical protein HPB50_024091 [Hyalomma asiaticum]